jgi:hypothetical protein
MEWFVFASRLICQVCLPRRVCDTAGKRLCVCCKDMRIHSHAFSCNLSTRCDAVAPRRMPFWGRRYYKSVWLYANIITISHNLSGVGKLRSFHSNLGAGKEV